jgi:hypothetical protein
MNKLVSLQLAFPIRPPWSRTPTSYFDLSICTVEMTDLGIVMRCNGYKPQPGQPDELFLPWTNIRAVVQWSDALMASIKLSEESKAPQLDTKAQQPKPTRAA